MYCKHIQYIYTSRACNIHFKSTCQSFLYQNVSMENRLPCQFDRKIYGIETCLHANGTQYSEPFNFLFLNMCHWIFRATTSYVPFKNVTWPANAIYTYIYIHTYIYICTPITPSSHIVLNITKLMFPFVSLVISDWKKIFPSMRNLCYIRMNINTFRPEQNVRHSTDNIFICIFLNETFCIEIKFSKGLFLRICHIVPLGYNELTHHGSVTHLWVKWIIPGLDHGLLHIKRWTNTDQAS